MIPLLSQGGESKGGGSTLWELTTRRFTKAIKAGANAGQPTALSALVSLYLAQVFAATEEEVVTFLSPLTARSRVREVLHALLGARQLETLAVEGRTLLHIPGMLPEAAQVAAAAPVEGEGGDGITMVAAAEERPKKVGTGRIGKFEGERKPGSEFRGKPTRAFGAGAGRAGAGRSGASAARGGASAGRPAARFGARADGQSDRERRPFKKDGRAAGPRAVRPGFAKHTDLARPSDFGKPSGSAKPSNFAKPWDEDRKARPSEATAAAAPDSFTKFRKPAAEHREPLGPREQAGLPPERRSGPPPRAEHGTFDRASKPGGFARRPYAPRAAAGGARPVAKRAYAPRASEGGAGVGFKPRSYEQKAERRAERKPEGGGGTRATTFGGAWAGVQGGRCG